MKLSEINSRNKGVKEFFSHSFTWDSWNVYSPSFRFNYLSRKGNTLKIEVWKSEVVPYPNWSGYGPRGYTTGDSKPIGVINVTVPMETIENATNFGSLMRYDRVMEYAKDNVQKVKHYTIH